MRLLLCEGAADEAFFRKLIATRNLPQFSIRYPGDTQRVETGGRNGFETKLRQLRTERGFESVSTILVVSDNDEDERASFAEVQAQITAADFDAPSAPLERTSGNPPIVIMMFPWVGEMGNLETLCLPAIYAHYPKETDCLNAFVHCTGVDTWGINRESQSRVRSMISSTCRSDPNTSLRYAWDRPETLIPLNHQVFDRVSAFLAGL